MPRALSLRHCFVVVALWFFAPFARADDRPVSRPTILYTADFSHGLSPKEWKPIKFSTLTEYTTIPDGTNFILKAYSNKTASGIGREVKIAGPAPVKVTWRWKIDRCPPGASDDKRGTFDHTARLFVSFRTFIGPPRTINYLWANQAAVGRTLEHPNSSRARFVVLQTGDAKAGQWITETRNLATDWKLLFGDDQMPDITGIGFITDSDGTATVVTGWYGDFKLYRD